MWGSSVASSTESTDASAGRGGPEPAEGPSTPGVGGPSLVDAPTPGATSASAGKVFTLYPGGYKVAVVGGSEEGWSVMRSRNPVRMVLGVAVVASLVVSGCSREGEVADVGAGSGATSSIATGVVQDARATDLAFSAEEERMARDLYRELGERWGSRPFLTIGRAEGRHLDLVVGELERLGLPVPPADAEPGTYADRELQELYDGWLRRGLESEAEAFVVGAELERRDIADLEEIIARTADPATKAVFERILQGSRNHLAAFAAGPGRRGDGSGPPR